MRIRPGKPRWCPTRTKQKHFNEAWAEIAAQAMTEEFGGTFQAYHCMCGWWHVRDRAKARRKAEAREPRNARRRRRKLENREQSKRETRSDKRLRHKRAQELPIRTWEDDGGACL
ncbi:hypothetical protein [Streptomyces microflavus]|uniref:hypothetical protein n=1 Tax=Streptomyces microflavus TaxID=1919 RepID=UPI0034053AE9